MNTRKLVLTCVSAVCCGSLFAQQNSTLPRKANSVAGPNDAIVGQAGHTIDRGRQIFRFDTFGDQAWWGGELRLHQAIEGAKFGGVGPGVSPRTALAVGLKVDVDALPPTIIQALKHNQVNLDDPAVTLLLLKLNSVVGVTGFFNASGGLKSVGIQCALCHSTVDDSFAPGIGHRLDGWAAQDLRAQLWHSPLTWSR
jgi:hypothetical protein